MHNSKLKQITIALCMVLMPVSVFAAGLGKLNVMSGLGEPLKADIELISITAEELSSITAAIASEEAYAVQGIEKPASHNTIKVDVAKNAAGAPILKLKSTQPISEPFLDMLIQVDWASGRLLREYTVLLDPPGYTGEADPNAQAPQTTQAPMVSSGDSKTPSAATNGDVITGVAAAPRPSKKTKKQAIVRPIEDEMVPVDAAISGDYVTQSGDTLSKLARELKPEGVSLEQMLVGLYQENPNAFQGDNMNRLKVGQIIRPPSEETLSAISRGEATKEVKVQTANWNAYRNKLAGIVADAAPSDAEASAQSAGGKIKSAEDQSIPASTGPKDVVKLSAGDAAAAKVSAENIKSLQDKIAALQEEATAREKSVKEAQDRTSSLEKQIADMQKLLALKNSSMADLQKQAEMQTVDEKAKAEQAIAEQAKAAEAAAAKPAAEAPQGTPIENAPAATEPPKPEVANADKPKPVVNPAPEPAPEQSFLDGLMGGLDLGLLAPAGGLLALLGGGWMYLRKKREKSLADFEQGIMTSGGLKANTVFGNTASASVDTGDTSFLTDFSQSANGGMIDTNDVDPIAEAEVYMAYGRDAQAEEILKDAISKEPKRYELHLKLLEMYAASKNVSAFETISGELYTTLGAEDPTWAKVAEIGIKLEPSNPLYQANSSAVGGNVAVDTVKSPASSTGAAGKLDATDFSDSPLAAEKDLDFSFDNDALTQGFAPTGTVKSSELVMDLGAPDEPAAPEASMDAAVEPAPELSASPDLSFDMDLNETAVKPEPVAAGNDGALEFDMGELGAFDAPVEAPIKAAEDFSNTMPGLDIPTFVAPSFMPEIAEDVPDLEKFGETGVETFEFPQVEVPATTEGVLDISDTVAEESDANNFSFDVHTIQPEAANLKEADFPEPKTYDLAAIDLTLNDDAKPTFSMDSESADTAVVGEPIEVDTKLDLVAAYIEMDDKVGAKELLDEIMKEGGTGQRKRAEALMAKIA